MSKTVRFFLVVLTLGLSILLAWLGLATIQSNFLGWFLLVSGTIYFFGVVIVYWVRRIRFWKPTATGGIVKEERDDWSFWFIVAGMIAIFYLPAIEYLFFKAVLPRNTWMQTIGFVTLCLGSTLFIWARRTLGHFYSGHLSVIEGQQLVQSGPYCFIRHPAYAGFILIALGLALGYSSVAGLAASLLLLLPSIIYRIRIEDKILAESFGAQYNDYAHRTKRLFPGIW